MKFCQSGSNERDDFDTGIEVYMVSMYSTIYVDDIREIKEENPFESMMSRFDRAAQLLEHRTRRGHNSPIRRCSICRL